MADVPFIVYTGKPTRRKSALIPRARWEDNREQIVSLYESCTLDEVIEKMAADGFTAKYVELRGIIRNKHVD